MQQMEQMQQYNINATGARDLTGATNGTGAIVVTDATIVMCTNSCN